MKQAQLRLASYLDKSKGPQVKKRKNNSHEELILSDEMVRWIDGTVNETDSAGYPIEYVSSVLAKPLDSMAVFCPTGDLVTAATTAIRPPEKPKRLSSSRGTSRVESRGHSESNLNVTGVEPAVVEENPRYHIQSAIDRLNVMWLKRKAALEEEEGLPEQAYNTLQDAINLHIGADSYENANVTAPVMASDPIELMAQIEDNYFSYDQSAHQIASKLQRWLHGRFMVRVNAATLIQSRFRGYKEKLRAWKRHHLRTQTAKMIQRKFRVHLMKMCDLATRIKAWYRGQLQKREFRKKLRIFRAARKIQSLYRGMRGRRIGNKKRLIRDSVKAIQRCFRGFLVRQERLWGIITIHKMLYRAARKIQCWFRYFLSIKRSQNKLVSELLREESRLTEEQAVIQRTLQVEIARVNLYLKTNAGKIHLADARQVVTAHDNHFQRIRHTLKKYDILAHEASIAFELYDTDGSGSIDIEEMTFMLRDLCIPMSKSAIVQLSEELDKDGSGDIDFSEFLDWYGGGGGRAAKKQAGMVGGIFSGALKARRMALEISGQTLERRCVRSVIRQCCTHLSRETKTLFRKTVSPKFQCCQCLQPFVLFMDYFMHFDKNSGKCPTLDLKGMFFRRYWDMDDWMKQRDCEQEVMRAKDEQPFLNYKSLMASYVEQGLQEDPDIASGIKIQVDAAEKMFHSILFPPEPETPDEDYEPKDPPNTWDLIVDIVDMCKDGHLSPVIAKFVAKTLGTSLPDDWLLNDTWPLSQFKIWVKINTQSFRNPEDEPFCCCSFVPTGKKCLPYTFRRNKSASALSEERVLGILYVGCLLLLQVSAEASLMALTEFRSRRPRRLKVKDPLLEKVGLSNVTTAAYAEVREHIIRRLRFLKLAKNKLYMEALQPRPSCFSFCKRFWKKDGSYAQVGLQGELDPFRIQAVMIEDAHARAKAIFGRKMLTEPGKAQHMRTTNELWAFKRHLQDKLAQGSRNLKDTDVANIEYLFNLFANPDCCGKRDYTMAISIHDLPILMKYLKLKSKKASIELVKNSIDPYKSDVIKYEDFLLWLTSGSYLKQAVILRGCRMFFRSKYYFLLSCLVKEFKNDAEMAMLIRTRQECRLRAEIQNAILEAMLTMSEKKLGEFFDEYGVMPGQESSASHNLDRINFVNNSNEQRLICRIAENEAEAEFLPKLKKTSQGREMLRNETLLLKKAKEMADNYGLCIPISGNFSDEPPTNNSQTELLKPCNALTVSRHLYVKNLVCTFDTDCSSSFDQEELSFLLQCLGASIDEKRILYFFPKVREDSVELKHVTDYLNKKDRLKWNNTRNKILSIKPVKVPASIKGALNSSYSTLAANILISKIRQQARERTEDARELAETGAIAPKDHTPGLISGCLLFRVQLFAMRQVHLFLRTVHGLFQLFLINKQCNNAWTEYVENSAFSRRGLILYAVDLHCELRGPSREKVILISEVPHIIRFLDLCFSVGVIDSKLEKIAEVIGINLCTRPIGLKESDKDILVWINFQTLVGLLEEVLIGQPNLQWLMSRNKKMLFDDAVWSMNSTARQQACVISVKETGFKVVSTNYRCRILAVAKTIRERRNSELNINREMYCDVIPKECALLYFLWRGFTFDDLMFDCENEDIINFSHWDGQISTELIDTKISLDNVKAAYLKKYPSRVALWTKLNMVPHLIMKSNFKRFLAVIMRDSDLVERWASEYVKELLTGVSSG